MLVTTNQFWKKNYIYVQNWKLYALFSFFIFVSWLLVRSFGCFAYVCHYNASLEGKMCKLYSVHIIAKTRITTPDMYIPGDDILYLEVHNNATFTALWLITSTISSGHIKWLCNFRTSRFTALIMQWIVQCLNTKNYSNKNFI